MSRVLSVLPDIQVIETASNGEEAISKSEDLNPDVVIMDVEMPVMDGLEATRRIKQSHPTMVVVLVSGSTDFLAVSLSAGADGFINKPFSTDSLICQVLDIFEGKEPL